jgi:hypothetical protein
MFLRRIFVFGRRYNTYFAVVVPPVALLPLAVAVPPLAIVVPPVAIVVPPVTLLPLAGSRG